MLRSMRVRNDSVKGNATTDLLHSQVRRFAPLASANVPADTAFASTENGVGNPTIGLLFSIMRTCAVPKMSPR